MKQRLLVAFAFGGTAAVYTAVVVPALWPDLRPDFGIVWFGARTLAEGRNPYELVGPGAEYEWDYLLLYPLTSMIAIGPLSALPLYAAKTIFAAIGAGLFAWALTRETIRNPQLLVFASPAMTSALQNVQWSPLLIAAATLTPAAWLLTCKPTIGVALLAWRPSWRSMLVAGTFVLLTIVIAPWWPAAWVSTLASTGHMKPLLLRPVGFILLLAAFKWRRSEARLLLALACIPLTPVIYEVVPLFLVVQRLDEGIALLLLTIVASSVSMARITAPEPEWLDWNARVFVWLLYLPCLVMVLRRPNIGATGESVERVRAAVRRYARMLGRSH